MAPSPIFPYGRGCVSLLGRLVGPKVPAGITQQQMHRENYVQTLFLSPKSFLGVVYLAAGLYKHVH